MICKMMLVGGHLWGGERDGSISIRDVYAVTFRCRLNDAFILRDLEQVLGRGDRHDPALQHANS